MLPRRMMPLRLILTITLLSLTACAGVPTPEDRLALAGQAAPERWREERLATRDFDLFALTPAAMKADSAGRLTVFLEGDGLAFIRRQQPSPDPTPVQQTVIGWLPRDGRADVAYLARPCQFTVAPARNCDTPFWLKARYSRQVVENMDEALTLLKHQARASRLRLIGYSGGGVIAALLAARRDDVEGFVAVAAPLDLDAFVAYHHVSPMTGSLNPRDEAARLAHVPQVLVVGGEDETVPRDIVDSYVAALPQRTCVRVVEVEGAEHGSGWDRLSPPLLDQVPHCAQVSAAPR
jgi:dienelactone hydrolase